MQLALQEEMCSHLLADQALHAFVSRVTFVDMHREPGPQLAALIHEVFQLDSVAVFDADTKKVHSAGNWPFNPDGFVRNAYIFETVSEDNRFALAKRVVRVGNFPVGALMLRGVISSEIATSVAALCGLTFDRYHSYANVGRTEAAREAEHLRTTVLDSLAHAYKTPLTAIQAANSGLIEIGDLSPSQRSLAALIAQQVTLLNDLTTRLLTTARLETQQVSVKLEPVPVAHMVEDALACCREQLLGFKVVVQVPEDLVLQCDRNLVTSLITQFIENAGKYGAAGTSVTVDAVESVTETLITVTNVGQPIPPAEWDHIFDTYYRSPAVADATSGTGVGLSIAKRTAQAHGGDTWVNSDEGGLTTFYASFPKVDGRRA